MRSAFIIVLVWILGPAIAQAELYSFVDAQGRLHFTNVPGDAGARPYRGDDIEGFGGQPPIVIDLPGSSDTVAYPVDVARYDVIIARAAHHYDLPFAFVKAVAKVESNFNPRAISPAQAKGLMQLMDATAEFLEVRDVFDPEQNVFGGARYLRQLANQFDGDLALTAAAYNCGPDRVRRLGRIPNIRETKAYVRRVLQVYKHYAQRR
ncbi:MAG: lytic transglycosylase domain-containing protein [Myxococcota bacterium]